MQKSQFILFFFDKNIKEIGKPYIATPFPIPIHRNALKIKAIPFIIEGWL